MQTLRTFAHPQTKHADLTTPPLPTPQAFSMKTLLHTSEDSKQSSLKTKTVFMENTNTHREYSPHSPRIVFLLTVKTIFTHARSPIYAPRVRKLSHHASLISPPSVRNYHHFQTMQGSPKNQTRFFREPCMLFPKTKRPFFNNQARFSTPTPNLSTISTRTSE